MPKPQLVLVALALLFFACGGKDAPAFDPSGQEWEFSLSNPLPINENLKVPEKTPIALRLRGEVFEPGDVFSVEGDSMVLENEYKIRYVRFPKKYPILRSEQIPDTISGFRLTEGPGTTLNAALYRGDSLLGEWIFEKKEPRFKEIAFGELDGQTFHCAFPAEDTMQVYFGTSIRTNDRDKGKAYEYFISEYPDFQDKRSYRKPKGFFYWGSKMSSMRNHDMSLYFSMSQEGFGSKRYTFGRDENGVVIASYFEVENGRYERVDMPLVLQGPVSADATEMDFADRINSGIVMADTSYAPIDSARVSYIYQDDYRGIEFDELSELEFSAMPGGEFIVVVRDRLVMNRKWRLSSDGNYLITLDGDGNPAGHYPILAYTDEHIDLRMPFTVKTREPRGVALESYATISVFIRIARRTDATSR